MVNNNYKYRLFIIYSVNDISELNRFLITDIQVLSIKYYNYKKDSLLIEVVYISETLSNDVYMEPVTESKLINDVNNELININPVKEKTKRFYSCHYELNGKSYTTVGIAQNKKQFLNRLYSKEQRLKKELNTKDKLLIIKECVEINFLEYVNLLKNSKNSK